jgi:hypothetical protein
MYQGRAEQRDAVDEIQRHAFCLRKIHTTEIRG